MYDTASTNDLLAENKERARGYLEGSRRTPTAGSTGSGSSSRTTWSTTILRRATTRRGTERGTEAFRRHVESVPAGVPDVGSDVRDAIAEDDRVTVRFVLPGTHEGRFLGVEPAGEEITMSGIVIYRFQDGKTVERWGEANTLGFLQGSARWTSRGVRHPRRFASREFDGVEGHGEMVLSRIRGSGRVHTRG